MAVAAAVVAVVMVVVVIAAAAVGFAESDHVASRAQAIDVCRQTRSFHILLIIADGQVTNAADTEAAIVEASNFPLSIIVVGVGDGDWDLMRTYDDRLPSRKARCLASVLCSCTVGGIAARMRTRTPE